jgi:hypothetical protein
LAIEKRLQRREDRRGHESQPCGPGGRIGLDDHGARLERGHYAVRGQGLRQPGAEQGRRLPKALGAARQCAEGPWIGRQQVAKGGESALALHVGARYRGWALQRNVVRPARAGPRAVRGPT